MPKDLDSKPADQPLHWTEFGEAIVTARELLGWEQKELAARAELGVSTLSAWENGNRRGGGTPRWTNLQRLERALGWAQGTAREVLRTGKMTAGIKREHGPPTTAAQPAPTPPSVVSIDVEEIRRLREQAQEVVEAADRLLNTPPRPPTTRDARRDAGERTA